MSLDEVGTDKKLNYKHKTMIGLLVRKAENLPEEKKNAEVRAMIETYNQVVDFVDYESLSPISEKNRHLQHLRRA